jgi:protein involved in polysaccharide export with SLBB domain
MRITDLVRAGGGLSDAAYSAEAELTRYAIVGGEFRQTELIPVNLTAALAGDAAANVPLAAYDYLNIKQISRWGNQEEVTLQGEFVFPGTYPIRPGEPLSSVIARAGGLTEFAFVQGSVFTRADLRETQREQAQQEARRLEADLASLALSDPDSEALSSGEALLEQLRNYEATGRQVIYLDELIAGDLDRDIILRGGDQLTVPEIRQEVMVLGEVQFQTAHTFSARLSRDDYVERSGGTTRRADEARILIVRANGDVETDKGSGWFRRGGGSEIRPGDTIFVPLDIERVRPLTLWTSVTQIVYNLAIAAAAVNSF